MSNDIKLGTTPEATAQRDAIHICLCPTVAAEDLKRGEHVGIDASGQASSYATPFVGIVDPFLPRPVAKGERLWICVYPNAHTKPRHHWEFSNNPVRETTAIPEPHYESHDDDDGCRGCNS